MVVRTITIKVSIGVVRDPRIQNESLDLLTSKTGPTTRQVPKRLRD